MPKMPEKAGGAAVPYAEGGDWVKAYPLLLGYMVDSAWPDGAHRAPGRLFLAPEGGQWVATLKEPTQGLILRVSVQYPAEAWPALEAALRLPAPPWQADPWEKGRRKK